MADFGRYFLVGVLLNTLVLYTDGVDVAILNQYPLIPHLTESYIADDGPSVLTCITDGTVQGSPQDNNYYFKVEFSPSSRDTFTTRRFTDRTPPDGLPRKVETTMNYALPTNDNQRKDVIGVFSCSGTKDGVTRKVSTVNILNTACFKPLAYTYRATVGGGVRIKVTTTSWCTPPSSGTIQLKRTPTYFQAASTAVASIPSGQTRFELQVNALTVAQSGTYAIVHSDMTSRHHLESYIRLIVTACPPDRTGSDCSLPCLCYHGGRCDEDGSCICPPGFYGDNCELGKKCSHCSGSLQ
ncbi:angiopoietin-1 receptor-like [Branchiostoma floridae x Branchiostoma japonicum]